MCGIMRDKIHKHLLALCRRKVAAFRLDPARDHCAGATADQVARGVVVDRRHALAREDDIERLDEIRRGCFAPLFYTLLQEDGSEFYDAEGWAEGFMRGVYLFSEPWMAVFEHHHTLLAPMVLLGTEAGWELLDSSNDIRHATQEAYEAIASAVALLDEHFRAQREVQSLLRQVHPGEGGVRIESFDMSVSTVARNDACPCGSGLKYKKCCGAPPTLH